MVALFHSIEISLRSLCTQLDLQEMNPVATDSCATVGWFKVLRRSWGVCEVDLFSSLSPGPRELQNTSKNVILYANQFLKKKWNRTTAVVSEPGDWSDWMQQGLMLLWTHYWCTDRLHWLDADREAAVSVWIANLLSDRHLLGCLVFVTDRTHGAFKRTALKPITSSEIVQKKVPLRMMRIMLEWRGVFMVL